MMEKSKEENQIPDFKTIISGKSDEELHEVLKKRKQYQKEAADFAVQEAIKRGIINSEQDLFHAEFNPEPGKFSLFPTIENEKARSKFKRSIARSLIIVGAVPIAWGGIKIFQSQGLDGILIFIFGVAWSLTSFQLMRFISIKLIYFMLLLLIVAVGYLVYTFVSISYFKTFDILFTVVLVGLVFYGIGFLGKLKD